MNPNDPVFKINQMMQNSKYLIDSELSWLQKMDKTIAGFYIIEANWNKK